MKKALIILSLVGFIFSTIFLVKRQGLYTDFENKYPIAPVLINENLTEKSKDLNLVIDKFIQTAELTENEIIKVNYTELKEIAALLQNGHLGFIRSNEGVINELIYKKHYNLKKAYITEQNPLLGSELVLVSSFFSLYFSAATIAIYFLKFP